MYTSGMWDLFKEWLGMFIDISSYMGSEKCLSSVCSNRFLPLYDVGAVFEMIWYVQIYLFFYGIWELFGENLVWFENCLGNDLRVF